VVRQRWEIDELIESWSLVSEDLGVIGNKSDTTRLGFAVLLKFFELEARFPTSPAEVPIEAVAFVARQLNLRFDVWNRYEWSGRSWKRHRRQIRSHFGFRAWSDDDIEPLIATLVDAITNSDTRRDRLTETAAEWCRRQAVEPPSATQLARFVGSAVRAWESSAAIAVAGKLSESVIERLESLLEPDAREVLMDLRRDPGAVGVETVLVELERLAALANVGVPADAFESFSSQVVEQWHDRFVITRPSALLAMSSADRVVLTSAWVHHRSEMVTDSLVDLLIAVVRKMGSEP
jgi:Domain of unknown function (DUF4158)